MTKENLPEVIEQKDIQVVDNSPMSSYQMILAQGGNVKDLKEMLEFQKLFEAVEAKKAYTRAMAEAKKNPPKIFKTKQVGFASKKPGAAATSYKHADLGDVTGQINEWLGNVGISSSFTPDQSNNTIKITCTLTHELGHSESVTLSGGADNTGNKNPLQSMGSTMSYLERYTLLSITGLATHDQDDDGQTSEIQYISEKQVSTITDMVNSIDEFTEESFLTWAKLESIATMPECDFSKAMVALKARSDAK